MKAYHYNNVTLEEILQKYFGLKGNLFLKRPKSYGTCCGETEYQYMTDKAEEKYSELIALLNDVNNLVGIDNFDKAIQELDNLTINKECD